MENLFVFIDKGAEEQLFWIFNKMHVKFKNFTGKSDFSMASF